MPTKIIDIFTVLKDQQLNLERWQVIAQSSNKEQHFMLMLAPLLEYAYCQLEAAIQTKYPALKNTFSENLLFDWVKGDLTALFNPMIARACALEMYSVGERGYLTGDTPEARNCNGL